MSITGNVIDIQKIQLTDTFQTWFAKTNEMVDALNPVNIYDVDDGIGTDVTFGVSGSQYTGVKYVNVKAGYGVAVGGGSGKPWTGVVSLDFSGISADAYTLTGNVQTITPYSQYTQTNSEVDANDYFLVLDTGDPTQTPQGTIKRVKAQDMLPRTIYQPSINLYGDLRIRGSLSVDGTGSSLASNTLSVASKYIYLAVTGASAPQFTASTLNDSGIVIGISGGTNKEIVWFYNSNNDYITLNSNYGAKNLTNALVNSKFIARNFVGGDGATSNAFAFEAAGGSATRLWLTESGVNPYFGIVKDAGSSNVNLNVYNGAGITSVAYIRAGATSQYTGVTANAFIQFANVDMVDGAHATTGASAWTIPVSDQIGQLFAERHNAGQIKRRFTQTSHGLTTGEAVTVILSGASVGTLTGAQADSATTEAIGIVDRVISANEVSVTMKGYYDFSANGLKGVGALAATGQIYYLDWNVKGGLTTSNSVPVGKLYQPMIIANTSTSGIVYGNEGTLIFPNATDEVYMRGMIPIGMIQPYAGPLSGLTMGLSAGTIDVSDVQYNQNYLPCDGRAVRITDAAGASGFADLHKLIGYTYSMRGVITSQTSSSGDTVIRPDRGTANLGSLSLPSGKIRFIRRGSNAPNQVALLDYSSGITADGTTITVKGIPTQNSYLGQFGDIVDILSPMDGTFFFLPDLRGKAPFGEYGPLGARGEGFNLGATGGTSVAGQTGATAVGDGGLFTNYIIRARRESDAMILTGHNHDSRYLRRDQDSGVVAGHTLSLNNLEVAGVVGLNSNIGIGMQPLSWASGSTGFALTVRRDGNFGTYAAVYNSTDDVNSRAGFAMNNGRTTGYLYLDRATSSTYVMATDQGASGGILISAAGNTGPVRISTNSTERMRITATGNVGIGASTPLYTLDVRGSAGISGTLFISNGGYIEQRVNFPTTVGGWARGIAYSDNNIGSSQTLTAGIGLLGSGSSASLLYMAHGTSPWASGTGLYITRDGSVGIGTTTPAVALDVVGEARTSTSTTYTSNAKTLTTKDYVDLGGPKFFTTMLTVFTGSDVSGLNTWKKYTLPAGSVPDSANILIVETYVNLDGGGTNRCGENKAVYFQFSAASTPDSSLSNISNVVYVGGFRQGCAGGDSVKGAALTQGIIPIATEGSTKYFWWRSSGTDAIADNTANLNTIRIRIIGYVR